MGPGRNSDAEAEPTRRPADRPLPDRGSTHAAGGALSRGGAVAFAEPDRGAFPEGQIGDLAAPEEHLRGRRIGAGVRCCIFCNNCRRRENLPGGLLQPAGHHRRWLPGQIAARHTVPPVGYGAVAGVSREGLRDGRRAAQESARAGRSGSFRRTHRARPGHPRERAADVFARAGAAFRAKGAASSQPRATPWD